MPDEQNDGADGRMLTVADDDRRARGQCRHPHHLEEASPLAQMDTPTKSTRVHGSSCATKYGCTWVRTDRVTEDRQAAD